MKGPPATAGGFLKPVKLGFETVFYFQKNSCCGKQK